MNPDADPVTTPTTDAGGSSVRHVQLASSSKRLYWGAAIVVVLALGCYFAVRAPTKSKPLDSENELARSVRLYNAGQYRQAAEAAQAFLKTNPNSVEALNNLAVSYLGLRQWDDAIRNAQEAIRLKPGFQLARNNLAWILKEQEKAGSPSAPTPESLLNLSLADFQAGRFSECISAAQGALKLRPNFAEAYNNIGACYAALNIPEEAIRADQEALRLKPDFVLARNNLAWAMKLQGNGSPAKR